MEFKYKIGFIGFGNMANAIYNGMTSNSLINKEDILIYDINKTAIDSALCRGMNVAGSNAEVADLCEYVVLAIKPQQAEEILSSVKCCGNVIISIMAGVKKEKIKSFLNDCAVVRCMPNSPALIGKGITAVDCSDLNEVQKEFVLNLFSAVGEAVEIKEDLMDAVTSISGSGPAYVYLFIDALIKAGMENGLDYETSKKLTIETLTGSAEMVKRIDTHIPDLINAVCSKGGTTIEAVNVFKDKGFDKTINEAVKACYRRAKELSK